MSDNPKILGLRTSIYKVSDLEKAKEWYSQVLDTKPYFDQPFYVGFNVAGYELGLQPSEESSEKPGNVFTYWGVEDIDTFYNHLINLGAISFEPPTEVGGGIKVASVKDPWDNIFGIIYNPHFKLS